MKYLMMIGFLGMLTTGCVNGAMDIAPDVIKFNPSMGWEMQKDVCTKKKPSVSVSMEWKLK